MTLFGPIPGALFGLWLALLAGCADEQGFARVSSLPVLEAGPAGTWDDVAVRAATVVIGEGARPLHRMWYLGRGSKGAVRGRWQVGLAESSDGLHWKRHPAGPVLSPGLIGTWDDEGIEAPQVLRIGSLWVMFYSGRHQGHWRIGQAVSQDGVSWRPGARPSLGLGGQGTWDSDHVLRPAAVIKNHGERQGLRLYYQGVDARQRMRIGAALSVDGGATFEREGGAAVLDVGPAGSFDAEGLLHPAVLRVAGRYHLWYSGTNGRCLRLGHAVSADGLRFRRDPRSPVLDVGGPQRFDSAGVLEASVVMGPRSLLGWYTGFDGKRGAIGALRAELFALAERPAQSAPPPRRSLRRCEAKESKGP